MGPTHESFRTCNFFTLGKAVSTTEYLVYFCPDGEIITAMRAQVFGDRHHPKCRWFPMYLKSIYGLGPHMQELPVWNIYTLSYVELLTARHQEFLVVLLLSL